MHSIDEKARSLFFSALERGTGEWRAYLEEVCGGDTELRNRVDQLLKAHEAQGSIHVGAGEIPDPAGAQTRAAEHPGTRIGPYKLVEVIGEGGMGVVYLAQQTEPVKRVVALKVIKAGMDSKQVLARFEAERQALALMDHPNIARVLEAGVIGVPASAGGFEDRLKPGLQQEGRPYFVMELVKGVPITKFCDERKLTPRERLELFVPVCYAIQHAHQKGIIHRDIKPNNVLVALYDGRPVPKVIDFGVAKAAGQPLTERTLVTSLGAVVGTPEYMSPEQAELNQLDIDTRSDVYSLGVLLYELLTGTTPLSRQRSREAPLLELLRVIREEDPPRPSARLSTLGPAAVTVSADRACEPRKLSALMRGELDWIVMKALEKDRSRRYETANSLAVDVQCYLAGEAVEAVPPSARYRMRKYLRRNMGPALAAAVVLLTLVGGIVGTSWGLIRAQRARDAETVRAEGEREARVAAENAERASRESEADTKAFSDFLVNNVLGVPRPAGNRGGLGIHITVREALEVAEAKIDTTFRDRPRAEAVARHALGVTFRLIGEPRRAEPHLRRAAALREKELGLDHEDTLKSLNSLGVLLITLGKPGEATPLLEVSLRFHQSKLGSDHPDTISAMANLGVSYEAGGEIDRALPLYEEAFQRATASLGPTHSATLNSMRVLAQRHGAAGKFDLALPLAQECLKLCRATLGPDSADTLTVMYALASCYYRAGKFDLALPLAEEALKRQTLMLGPDHVETSSSMLLFARCLRAKGRFDQAAPLYEKVIELRTAKLGSDHQGTLLAISSLARAYEEYQKYDLAMPLAEQAFKLHSARHGPEHTETITSMTTLASCYRGTKNPGRAQPLFRRALELQRKKRGDEHPVTLLAMNDLAQAYREDGKLDLALPLLQQAAVGIEKREFKDQTAPLIVANIAIVLEQLQQFEQAEKWRRKMVTMAIKRDGKESVFCNTQQGRLGYNLLKQKKFVEAEPVLRECLSFRDKTWPDSWMRSSSQLMLGVALLGQKKSTEAEPLLRAGYDGLEKHEAQIPEAAKDILLRDTLEQLVQLYEAQGMMDHAEEWRKKVKRSNDSGADPK